MPEPPLRFDVGNTLDLPAEETTECTKVDLLFVIDNSGSMADHQDNLLASFSGFVQGMRDALASADSYHVGIVTTDHNGHNGSPCAGVLGALVTATGGPQSSNGTCGPWGGGRRFMTDQDDLEGGFACAGQVGIGGSGFERPMEAMIGSLSPALGAPGGCNEGFLRDDALLVTVVITDEDDVTSPGDPINWYVELVGSKGGHEDHIVFLGLLGHDPPNQCVDQDVHGAERLVALASSLPHGEVGDVCAPSYVTYFERAVDVIEVACDGFNPG